MHGQAFHTAGPRTATTAAALDAPAAPPHRVFLLEGIASRRQPLLARHRGAVGRVGKIAVLPSRKRHVVASIEAVHGGGALHPVGWALRQREWMRGVSSACALAGVYDGAASRADVPLFDEATG